MSIARVDHISYGEAGFGDTLTHDLAYGVPKAHAFFPPQSRTQIVERVLAKTYPRAELAAALEATAKRLDAPAAALENIAKLRDTNTCVVITGQQAGLLGGPLYSLHKALTVIKLARQYEAEANGRARFVPVFWVAADDHDLEEIRHAALLDSTGELRRVQTMVPSECAGVSASRIFMEASSQAEFIQQMTAAGIPQDAAVELAEMYTSQSFSDAFARLFYRWMGQLGLVVALSTDARPLGRELLLKELDAHGVTSRLVAEAAAAMQSREYTPGFAKAHAGPHFFIETTGNIRAALDWNAATEKFDERSTAFSLRKVAAKSYTRAELAALIQASPGRFSAAAALRPLLQNAIFPVVAVALGPGEIAYWAQLRAVHEHFGVVWPEVLPRVSMTLIDPRGEKMLRKLGLQEKVGEAFSGSAELEKKFLLSDGLAKRLYTRRDRILAEIDGMLADIREHNHGLDPLFEKAKSRVEHELDRVAQKTAQVFREKDGVEETRIKYLASLLRPKNSPQERVLSAAQFVLAFPQLPAELLDVIDPADKRHVVVTIG